MFREVRRLILQAIKVSALTVLLVSGVKAEVNEEVERVAREIVTEAIRSNNDPDGHPLPLVSHWNTGKYQASKGWEPRHQLQLIEQGHYILPWFEYPDDRTDTFEQENNQFAEYYEWAIKRARDLGLPIVLVSSQWERFLSAPPYLNLPADQNPNVLTRDGKVLPEVCPFAPIAPWYEVGRRATDNEWVKTLQNWYPDPPRVIFLSNNEHKKLQWKDVEESARYLNRYGRGRSDAFKRGVVADGWIQRYRTLEAGMRGGLVSDNWKRNAIFVGYEAFGVPHFGRWDGWMDYSLYVPGRIDANPLTWDGGSASYYLHPWSAITDFTTWSPQIEFMNVIFQQEEAHKINPEFWIELSVADGHDPDALLKDKRKQYAALGQTFTPERYAGLVQFGMWLVRPRVVREFRAWQYPWKDGAAYFMAIVHSVDSVHMNPILRHWWRKGQLVPNTAHQHPYQSNIPSEYAYKNRWYLLDADVNPTEFPWGLFSEVPVYALALTEGVSPRREWLIYAHSPLGERKNVQLRIPEYSKVSVDISVGGSYFLVSEYDGSVQEIR